MGDGRWDGDLHGVEGALSVGVVMYSMHWVLGCLSTPPFFFSVQNCIKQELFCKIHSAQTSIPPYFCTSGPFVELA